MQVAEAALVGLIAIAAIFVTSLAIFHALIIPEPDKTVAKRGRGVSVQITFSTTIQGIT